MNSVDIIDIQFLCKKKVFRDFITLFNKTVWKQLIASLVEYAILNMKRNNIDYNTLSADEIVSVVDCFKLELANEEKKAKVIKCNKSNNKTQSYNRSQSKKSLNMNTADMIKPNFTNEENINNYPTRNNIHNKSTNKFQQYKPISSYSTSSNITNTNKNDNKDNKPRQTSLNKTKFISNKNLSKENKDDLKFTAKDNTNSKSKPKEFKILEKIQLEKIKQKRKDLIKNEVIYNAENPNLEKYKQNINSKVESKIKNDIQIHKKIYNININKNGYEEFYKQEEDVNYDYTCGLEDSIFTKNYIQNQKDSNLKSNFNQAVKNINYENDDDAVDYTKSIKSKINNDVGLKKFQSTNVYENKYIDNNVISYNNTDKNKKLSNLNLIDDNNYSNFYVD